MKKLIMLLFTVLFSVSVNAQMCNTTPTNMGVLTPTGTWQNVAANSGAKRYWTFTATAGCTYDFSSCNSINTNDTYLRLYSGTNPLTAVLQTSNDDNGPFCLTNKASLSWVCPTTGTYSILFTNYVCANISSNSILSYRVTCLPPWNPCTTIPTITCGTSNNLTVGSGNGIYNPPSTSCGFTTPGKEYIYSFTPTITGNYTISQPTSFGYIDWFYKIASGGCNGTGWTCIDDITNGNIGNANVNIFLTAGVTYYIMADPESTTGGNVTWTLNCPILPPSNDSCSGAINILTIPYTSSVLNNNSATDDVPTSSSLCGTQGSNVWFKLTGNGNLLTATTCSPSTNFDTEVRVYTGTCPSLNSMIEMGCNDDDVTCTFSGLRSTVTWCSDPGITYYISVGYFASGAGYGNYVLTINDGAACSTALPIELIEFTGQAENNYNLLRWKTASEINNDYFTLETSIDGISWSVIYNQTGAGNSNEVITYEYKDYFFKNDVTNYYRLSQTDYNGVKEYFDIIAIHRPKSNDCDNYKYFNLMGQEVDIQKAPSGVYVRKCEEYPAEKIIKY